MPTLTAYRPTRAVRLRQRRALLMLERKGPILEMARLATKTFKDAGLDFAVVGGVAVFLHGYERSTTDVDIYVGPQLVEAARLLESVGLVWDTKEREFRDPESQTPIQLIGEGDVRPPTLETLERDRIQIANLADIISMKLDSGMKFVRRSRDLADVVDLIRILGLTSRFASRIDKRYQPEFRRLVEAIRKESE